MPARLLLNLGLALFIARSDAAIEGIASNMALVTDATQPPAIRDFNLRTFELHTAIEYTLADLVKLGVESLDPTGTNRTLRPAGIALLEGAYFDTVFWADAGAGAILGMRFDSSGLRVLAHGGMADGIVIEMPEALVIDATDDAYIAAGGYVLYWGDSSANKISRCTVDTSAELSGAGSCANLVDVLASGVTHVAGLAIHSSSRTLYWADGYDLRIRSVTFDPATGIADAAMTLTVVVPYVAMPSALGVETCCGGVQRLYYLDQATPTSLSRVWLNGNGTQKLIQYGLSRPRGIAFARDAGFYLIVDSGTKQLLLALTGSDVPSVRSAYEGTAGFEPRGVAMRADVSVLIKFGAGAGSEGDDALSSPTDDSAAPGSRRGRSGSGVTLAATGVALICSLAVRSLRSG